LDGARTPAPVEPGDVGLSDRDLRLLSAELGGTGVGGFAIPGIEVALDRYQDSPGNEHLDSLVQAADRYSEFLWTHMSTEEKGVLPECEKHLTSEDWRQIAGVAEMDSCQRSPLPVPTPFLANEFSIAMSAEPVSRASTSRRVSMMHLSRHARSYRRR
jgi:hypothetical protein